MAPVVAAANGDAARVEEDEQGVEGGQPGRVGEGGPAEERGEEGLEARSVGRRKARVDVRGRAGVGPRGERVRIRVVAEGGRGVEGWSDGAVRVEVVVGVDGECGGGERVRSRARRGRKRGGCGPGFIDGEAGRMGRRTIGAIGAVGRSRRCHFYFYFLVLGSYNALLVV